MASLFHISEAAAIGIHAALMLADSERPLSAKEIAGRLGGSFDHTVRVMNRLRQAGVVTGRRGPAGGFRLTRDPGEITLLDVYEALEGTLEDRHCLFQTRRCGGGCPVFGRLTGEINALSRKFFSETTLRDAARNMEETL